MERHWLATATDSWQREGLKQDTITKARRILVTTITVAMSCPIQHTCTAARTVALHVPQRYIQHFRS